MSDSADRKIRVLVNQLVDCAPPAPPFPGIQIRDRRSRRRKLTFIAIPLVFAVAPTAGAVVIPALVETSPGYTRLFVRNPAAGLVIRAYQWTPVGGGLPGLEAELSSPRGVAVLTAGSEPIGPRTIKAVQSTVIGPTSESAAAVAVRTGSDVVQVRAVIIGRQDTMRSVDGWAVLGALADRAEGRVSGYDAQGRLVESVKVPPPSRSGEGFPGESVATFERFTSQNVLVIGHTVPGADGGLWLYPYLADPGAVQQGLEGIPSCGRTGRTH